MPGTRPASSRSMTLPRITLAVLGFALVLVGGSLTVLG